MEGRAPRTSGRRRGASGERLGARADTTRETAVAATCIEPERRAALEVLADGLPHERVDPPAAELHLLARRAAAGEDDERLEQLGGADHAEEAVLGAIEIVVDLAPAV